MLDKEINIFQSRIAAKHKNICFVALDAAIHVLYFSKATEQLGLSPDAVTENMPNFLNFIHPGDANYFLAKLDSDLMNPFDRTILKYRFRPSPEAPYIEVHNVVYHSQAASLTGGKSKMYSSYLAAAASSDLSDFLLDAGEMECDIRFKYSFDKLFVPMLMTQEFRITYANPEAAKTSDQDIETLHGLSVFDIASKNDHTLIRKILTGRYKKSTADKYCSTFKKDKDKIEIDIIGCAPNTDTKPTSLALFWDASENTTLKNLLTAMYKALDEIDQAVAVFSLNHEIEWVNRTFSAVTGYTLQEAFKKKASLLNIYNDNDRNLWKNVHEKGYWKEVVIHRRKNGQGYPAKIKVTGLENEHGIIIKYIAFFQDITNETEKEKRYRTHYSVDHLTTLYNRKHFLGQLSQMIKKNRKSDRPFHMLTFDINRFSIVNNTAGYAAGDEVLKMVAHRLKGFVQNPNRAARIGEDSFALIFENYLPEKYGELFAGLFKYPVFVGTNYFWLTVSAGISTYPDHGQTPEQLLKAADTALQHAKIAWDTEIKLYDHKMAVIDASLENDFRNALSDNQFVLHYQPLMNVDNDEICGAEALVRWLSPTRGLVMPGKFIDLAEKTGLIAPLGKLVLNMALKQIHEWKEQNLPPVKLSVNISNYQLGEPDFLNHIMKLTTYYNVDPRLIELEITESSAMSQREKIQNTIFEMSKLGFSFSIDDFGIGHSSLDRLHKMPISTIKIDRSFIKDILTDSNSRAIVNAIVSMSKNLGMETIAEGIETKEQLAYLKQIGCSNIQGYLISKPVPPEQFVAFMQKKSKNKLFKKRR